jgi:hypothetical protein
MTEKRHTIRIVDNRTSKRRAFWKQIALITALPLSVFVPGLLADSAAMQWTGFGLFIVCGGMALDVINDQYLDISEARKRLDELERKETS